MQVQELNVYVVISNQEKVLMLQMKNGLWEFAGGGIEWGETPEQAAMREAKEETSLTVSNLTFLGITSAKYEKDGNQKHSIYIVYQAESANQNTKVFLSSEHIGYRWLNISELQFLKLGLNAEPIIDMLKE